MNDEPAASGQPGPPDDRAPLSPLQPIPHRQQLSPLQRVLLYFNTTRRKFWAGTVFVALWFLLLVTLEDVPYLGHVPNLFLYIGAAVLWILFTHGAGLAKPPPMPAEIMRQDAPGRFSSKEEWQSPLPPDQALEALKSVFEQPGVRSEVMDRSLWVQLGKEWQAAAWWHRDAARHMKRRPALQFFVEAAGGGSRVSAYSVDRMLMGLYDVVKLSDEMSATAVELARNATGAPPKGKPPKGRGS